MRVRWLLVDDLKLEGIAGFHHGEYLSKTSLLPQDSGCGEAMSDEQRQFHSQQALHVLIGSDIVHQGHQPTPK